MFECRPHLLVLEKYCRQVIVLINNLMKKYKPVLSHSLHLLPSFSSYLFVYYVDLLAQLFPGFLHDVMLYHLVIFLNLKHISTSFLSSPDNCLCRGKNLNRVSCISWFIWSSHNLFITSLFPSEVVLNWMKNGQLCLNVDWFGSCPEIRCLKVSFLLRAHVFSIQSKNCHINKILLCLENGQICLKLNVWKCYKLYRVHNIFCVWSYLYKLRSHKHLMLWKDLTCLPNDELLWSLPPWIQLNLSCPYNNVSLNFLLGARLCIRLYGSASLFHNWTKCSFWYFSNTNSNSLYESNSAWSSIFL